jgi:Na+-transporting methylmalonyl-CoA/oxaloacetate decarboxylase gamma subunit
MAIVTARSSIRDRREAEMDTLLAIITIAFVFLVLLFVAYALYEMSPFARHREGFHEPGERQNSPRLD